MLSRRSRPARSFSSSISSSSRFLLLLLLLPRPARDPRLTGAAPALMDRMMSVRAAACCSPQWLAAVLLSVCCLLPCCLPAGHGMDYSPWFSVDNLVVRQGETATLR